MLSFRNVRLNVENLYQYLKDNLKEIEEGVTFDDENRIKSITGLHKIANKVVITAEQDYESGNSSKEIEILSINCDSANLDFQIFDEDAMLMHEYLTMFSILTTLCMLLAVTYLLNLGQQNSCYLECLETSIKLFK